MTWIQRERESIPRVPFSFSSHQNRGSVGNPCSYEMGMSGSERCHCSGHWSNHTIRLIILTRVVTFVRYWIKIFNHFRFINNIIFNQIVHKSSFPYTRWANNQHRKVRWKAITSGKLCGIGHSHCWKGSPTRGKVIDRAASSLLMTKLSPWYW